MQRSRTHTHASAHAAQTTEERREADMPGKQGRVDGDGGVGGDSPWI